MFCTPWELTYQVSVFYDCCTGWVSTTCPNPREHVFITCRVTGTLPLSSNSCDGMVAPGRI